MAEARVERRLAAIFAGDIVDYSRLMGADEEGTLSRLNAHRREFLEPKIAEHRGRIVSCRAEFQGRSARRRRRLQTQVRFWFDGELARSQLLRRSRSPRSEMLRAVVLAFPKMLSAARY